MAQRWVVSLSSSHYIGLSLSYRRLVVQRLRPHSFNRAAHQNENNSYWWETNLLLWGRRERELLGQLVRSWNVASAQLKILFCNDIVTEWWIGTIKPNDASTTLQISPWPNVQMLWTAKNLGRWWTIRWGWQYCTIWPSSNKTARNPFLHQLYSLYWRQRQISRRPNVLCRILQTHKHWAIRILLCAKKVSLSQRNILLAQHEKSLSAIKI